MDMIRDRLKIVAAAARRGKVTSFTHKHPGQLTLDQGLVPDGYVRCPVCLRPVAKLFDGECVECWRVHGDLRGAPTMPSERATDRRSATRDARPDPTPSTSDASISGDHGAMFVDGLED